jgi:hypothetical protein
MGLANPAQRRQSTAAAAMTAPAQYKVTGVKTFIVSHDGVVYEKDLGQDTLKIFQSVDRYNPDKTWRPTEDQW